MQNFLALYATVVQLSQKYYNFERLPETIKVQKIDHIAEMRLINVSIQHANVCQKITHLCTVVAAKNSEIVNDFRDEDQG